MTTPTPPLLSAKSGKVKTARKLGRRSTRVEHRLFLAEGAKALTEALRVPGAVVEVFATAEASEQYAALRKAVDELGVPWLAAGEDAISVLSGAVTPQGIVAVCRFLDVEVEDVLAPGEGTVVLCADVRDPGNAGTVIRTADAAGARGVVLAGHSVDPYNDKTVRASVGSLWHLPVALAPDSAACVGAARAAGFTVLAADGAGETDLFGNEAWGLPEELAALADHRVSIPILGRAESLNLATAAAVCLYASARAQR